jgi:hypothetical protein
LNRQERQGRQESRTDLKASPPQRPRRLRFVKMRTKNDMRIPGERIKRTQLIQTDQYVVAVDVEMVIPKDDPSEPCYESETVEYLQEVKEHAERGPKMAG